MHRQMLIFSALLLSTSLTASPLVPSSVAYPLVVFSYVVVFISFVRGKIQFFYYRPIFYPALLIWILFFVSFLTNFEHSSILRLLSFTFLTGVNIFILPAIVDRWTVYRSLTRVSAVLVIIGLPAALFGAYSIGPFTFEVWSFPQNIIGFTYHIPTSIFASPNQLAEFTVLGAVTAGAEWSRRRGFSAAVLLIISIVGVFVSDSRTGWLALIAATCLYFVYIVLDRNGLMVASIGGLAVFVILLLGLSDVIILPFVSDISLTGRDVLWKATIKAIKQRPLFGWGLGSDQLVLNQWIPSDSRYYNKGTHNSYLRAFLIGGIVAGVCYLVLSITSLLSALRKIDKNVDSRENIESLAGVFCVILLFAFFIIQSFGGSMIYGVSPISTIGAIVVGYAHPDSAIRTISLPSSRNEIREKILDHHPF